MRSISTPPGPKGNFFFGNFAEYARDPLGFLTNCAREFGDVVSLRIPATRIYLLSNPQHVEQVLTATNRDFTIHGGMKIPITRKLFGGGLLTSEGKEWQRQRRLTFPLFTHSMIEEYAVIMADETEAMLSGWRHGQSRDIYAEMIKLTVQIATKGLFGTDRSAQVSEIAKNFADLKDAYYLKNRWQGLGRMLPLPVKARYRAAVKKIDDLTDEMIRQRHSTGSRSNDLLSVLMAAEYEEGKPISDKRLRGELKTFLITGHAGPSTLLGWAIYLLTLHPESAKKVLAEVDEVLGSRLPEAADLRKLKYTSYILKETLRLYPPLWFVAREAVRDCEIGGFHVPKGTQMVMSQWIMHRDTRFWEKPEEFRPERWNENSERNIPKYSYFPYSGGPRFCMGYAYTEMLSVLVLAMVIRKFDFEIRPGETIDPLLTAALVPKNGINLKLIERSKCSVS